MAKQLMNEAERFLLEHWVEARLLEESMEEVRAKYKLIFERIVEAVNETHPELDMNRVALTQAWTDGSVGFGRRTWPTENRAPSGFWVENLKLEVLIAEDSDAPLASVWVNEKTNLDFGAARDIVSGAVKELFPKEEAKKWTRGDDEGYLIWRETASKADLLSRLLEGDGEAFVELLVSEFDLMARLIPVLDRVFGECMLKQ